MSTTEILREAKQRGIVLEVDGEAVRYRAPRGRLTPDLLAVLKERKPEILQALRGLTVKARVRGQDAVVPSAHAEVCWHCHGEKVCRCAFCAVRSPALSWEPGPCGACFATGFLTWPETVQ